MLYCGCQSSPAGDPRQLCFPSGSPRYVSEHSFCRVSALLASATPAAARAQDADQAPPRPISRSVDGAATLERDGQSQQAGDQHAARPRRSPADDDVADWRSTVPDGAVLDVDEYSDHRSAVADRAAPDAGTRAPRRARRGAARHGDALSNRHAGRVGTYRRPGEYRLRRRRRDGTGTELDDRPRSAALLTERGTMPVEAGELSTRARRSAVDAAAVQLGARRRVRSLGRGAAGCAHVDAASDQYLPPDLQMYGAALDQNGSWDYAAPYGYVWYPRVADHVASVLRRPVVGDAGVRLDVDRRRPLVVADASLRALGLQRRRTPGSGFPGRTWGPAWVAVGGGARLRELVSARLRQPAALRALGRRRVALAGVGDRAAHGVRRYGYRIDRYAVSAHRFSHDTPFVRQSMPPVAVPRAVRCAAPSGFRGAADRRCRGARTRARASGARPRRRAALRGAEISADGPRRSHADAAARPRRRRSRRAPPPIRVQGAAGGAAPGAGGRGAALERAVGAGRPRWAPPRCAPRTSNSRAGVGPRDERTRADARTARRTAAPAASAPRRLADQALRGQRPARGSPRRASRPPATARAGSAGDHRAIGRGSRWPVDRSSIVDSRDSLATSRLRLPTSRLATKWLTWSSVTPAAPGIVALFIVAAMLGILSGVLFAYAGDLPQVSALDDYRRAPLRASTPANGQVIGEFATQRRVVVGYDDINPLLRKAIIATEDAEFNRHFGINIWRIAVAALTDILERRRAQGASTLTQQLARNLKEQFGLTNEKSFERKIREAILAIQIEKRYTKKEIFTIYCNQMYLGHGAYGVEAASRLYFDKSNKQLTLEEAALIAGLFQTPERQSPFVDMKRAIQRRNIVLQRMADEGYITQADGGRREAEADRHARPADAAARHRAVLRRGGPQAPRAPVRREGAVRGRPLRADDARREPAGDRGPGARARACARSTSATAGASRSATSIAEGHTIDGYRDDRWNRADGAGRRRAGGGRAARPKPRRRRALRIGRLHADLAREGFAWTRRAGAMDLFKPGDLVEVADRQDRRRRRSVATVSLEQTPLVEGAILAIDNRTGQIKAMVGGWSFTRSKFNRAVQAYRQMGSTFKPIVYTTAIDRGFTPSSILVDRAGELSAGERPGLQPAQLRPQVRGADHAALGARGLAQHPRDQDDGHARAEERPRLREALRVLGELPALPADCARRRRRDARGSDERLHRLPEPGRAHEAVRSAEGHRPRRQPARGQPRRAERRDPGGHGVRHDEPAARRRPARHGGRAAASSTGRSRARPARSTTTPTRGSSASIPTSRSASGSGTTRRSRSAASSRASFAALPIWMDFMKAYIDGAAGQGQSAAVRTARQHRLPAGGQAHRRGDAARHAGLDHRGVHLRARSPTRPASRGSSTERAPSAPHRANERRQPNRSDAAYFGEYRAGKAVRRSRP